MIDIKQNTLLKIVQSLIETPKQTIRELSRTTKTTYYLIQNNVAHLHKAGIIRQEKVGRSLLCSLDCSRAMDYIFVAELAKKEKFFEQNKQIRAILQELQEMADMPFFILLIFGSYAKYRQKEKSDIDILIITETAEQIGSFEALIHDISRTTALELHPTVVDRQSFGKMLQKPRELNVANESLNEHVLVYGTEQYWMMRIKYER